MSLKIHKLSYPLGAEISGVAITKTITDETFHQIYRAFLEHCILLFRGQSATREQFDFLTNHVKRPQFVYHHQWQKNDLLIWDNRCTKHNALGDYDRRNELRVMEKTYVPGLATGYLYDDPTGTRSITAGVPSFT